MTSLKQIEANRRNTRKSNAVRNVLPAEIAINALEDAEGLQKTDVPTQTLQSQDADKIASTSIAYEQYQSTEAPLSTTRRSTTRDLRRLLVTIAKFFAMFARGFLSNGEPTWCGPKGSQAVKSSGDETSDSWDALKESPEKAVQPCATLSPLKDEPHVTRVSLERRESSTAERCSPPVTEPRSQRPPRPQANVTPQKIRRASKRPSGSVKIQNSDRRNLGGAKPTIFLTFKGNNEQ